MFLEKVIKNGQMHINFLRGERMERSIDRREYRRNAENTNVSEEEQIDIWQKRIRKVLWQFLGMAMILLTISCLKFFHCEEAIYGVKELLNQQITLSSLKKDGQRIFEKATECYTSLNTWVETSFPEDGKGFWGLFSSGEVAKHNALESKGSGENGQENTIGAGQAIGENTNLEGDTIGNSVSGERKEKDSGDNQETNYEVAVEGMNQMLEDALLIKENYSMTVPVIGTITSEFGVRNSSNPIVSSYHSGLDIAANTGTQILAALDGEVLEAATDTYYGNYLKIQKDDLIMIYAHCSKLLVKAGDQVKKGELIAYVGNTGNSTGPHLHFELRYQNRLVDPRDILGI